MRNGGGLTTSCVNPAAQTTTTTKKKKKKRKDITARTAAPVTETMDNRTPAAASDLVDRMRRLSVTSNASSFSVVSAASSGLSVHSLNSNGSITGGIQVAQAPEQSIVLVKQEQKGRRAASTQVLSTAGGVDVATTPGDELNSGHTKPTPTATACPFWYQFDDFEPSPTAKFKDEFARLAKSQAWGTSQKRKREVAALRAEVAFHHGTCAHKLDRWQELCEEMGVDTTLTSISQCRKVRSRLQGEEAH